MSITYWIVRTIKCINSTEVASTDASSDEKQENSPEHCDDDCECPYTGQLRIDLVRGGGLPGRFG
jgi:hypothetical protein